MIRVHIVTNRYSERIYAVKNDGKLASNGELDIAAIL